MTSKYQEIMTAIVEQIESGILKKGIKSLQFVPLVKAIIAAKTRYNGHSWNSNLKITSMLSTKAVIMFLKAKVKKKNHLI